MEHILESLDEAVFTPELKATIQAEMAKNIVEIEDKFKEQLSEAEVKLTEAEKQLEDIKEAHKAELDAVEKKADAYGASITETMTVKAEAYADKMQKHYDSRTKEYAAYIQKELTESMSAYLDSAVEAFIEQNRMAIDESVQVEKAKAILEGIDSIVYTAGVSVASIQEAVKPEAGVESEVEALKAKIDSLLKENVELKRAAAAASKDSIVEEVAKDLTVVQRDRFDRLAKIIPFNESSVEVFKESLEKVKLEILDKVEEEAETISESVTAEEIVEAAKPAYMRFL